MLKFTATLLAGTLLAVSALAAESALDAASLYSKRGLSAEGVQAAQASSEMYERLAASATGLEKSNLLNHASEAVYYVGSTKASSDPAREVAFKKGYELASASVEAFGPSSGYAALDADSKAMLCQSLYFKGINLGKGAEYQNVGTRLIKWATLRPTMQTIIDLGYAKIQDYGASRTLGRAWTKLTIPNHNEYALDYLSQAYEGTRIAPGGPSNHGLNTLFLAELLVTLKRKDEAKAILQRFVAADYKTLNPNRVPETLDEQEQAKKLLETL